MAVLIEAKIEDSVNTLLPSAEPKTEDVGMTCYVYRLASILRDLTQYVQEITLVSEKLTEADAHAKAEYNAAQYNKGKMKKDPKDPKKEVPDEADKSWGAVALAEWYEVNATFDKDGKDTRTGKTQNQLHTEFQTACTKLQQLNDQMDEGLQTARNEVQSCGSALSQIDQNNNNILSQTNLISQLLTKN